jgi:hypothetical protein
MDDNLDSLHAFEEKLRADHKALVRTREDLSDHVGLVKSAMNILHALTKEHDHRSDDELTLQLLGLRLFNTMAASIKLSYAGYYQNAFSALRDFLEAYFLLDYLAAHPHEIAAWRAADKKTLRHRYGPAAIRQALDKRDGLKQAKRKELYDLMSHVATHATPSGFRLATKDGLGEIGPFFDQDKFQAWAEEAAKMAGHAGVIFGHAIKQHDRKLLPVKDAYLENLGGWRQKYLQGDKARATKNASGGEGTA